MLFRRNCLQPCLLLLGVSALLGVSVAVPAEADPRYDHEWPRKVATVIPPDLIDGDVWRVRDQVTPVEGLFRFEMETPWGDFPVYGEAMLRMRAREFRAVAELESISSTEAGLEGAGRSVQKSFVRLGNAFIHPKRTAKAIPQGTRRLFRKLDRYANKVVDAIFDDDADIDRNAAGEGNPSDSAQKAAVWLTRKYGGVGSKLRNRAREVGVDPYTSNEILAAELERLSRAEAVGSVSTKFLMPAMIGTVGLMADAANLAYVKDWREIFTYNAGLMRAMGVEEELILAFEVNEFYTPMTQTLLVGLLDAMEGVVDRGVVIQQAVLLENESESLFFLESIMLAEWYHREQSPLQRFYLDTLIPVAVNERGDLVAFTAADYFYWTREAARLTREFTATYADHPGGRELVTADYVSKRARAGVEAMGWQVMSDLRLTYDVEIPWGRQDHE
jgi:hypothetical protein